ncbi:DUF1348 family protein [Caulobacter hibisci]|uniref:DUF1348 family protein n=1 Tax=Caulobacter hibisci TaxID=2035993 RepID=A0ABS0T4B6_9CAUL|nr:DUF1348 family protein [Caulobacter hibisci]MBI1686732.1 DUF1348 family protein [Caulobacter hibisci]
MTGRASPDPSPDLCPERQRALVKVRDAENASNLRDFEGAVLHNSIDCQWRSRADYFWGREQIRAYLARRWRRETERRVITELWAAEANRLALRFVAEFRDDGGDWRRAHGAENWELNAGGLIRRRFTSVNEQPIQEHERVLRWPAGVRPDDHPALSDLGL